MVTHTRQLIFLAIAILATVLPVQVAHLPRGDDDDETVIEPNLAPDGPGESGASDAPPQAGSSLSLAFPGEPASPKPPDGDQPPALSPPP